MKFDKIPVDKIKRAQIRYYEKGQGCELPEVEAYTFFVKVGDAYINLIHPYDECNVYLRTPYSNSTADGESYGSMLKLVNGKEEDGVCYVLDNRLDVFRDKEEVSLDDVEKEILSDYSVFYYDRWDLVLWEENTVSILDKHRVIKLDSERREKFLTYINSKEEAKKLQKTKKDKICLWIV